MATSSLSFPTLLGSVSLALCAFGGFNGQVSWNAVVWCAVCCGVSGFLDDVRAKRRCGVGLENLRAMNPHELELHVARVLSGLPGWQAEATRASADQGADVIAVGPKGQRVAVQVKRYEQNVGNDAVQAVVASKALYRCTGAVVVTSGLGFTKAARELAVANEVKLWGPGDLLRLQQAARDRQPAPDLLPRPPAKGWWG